MHIPMPPRKSPEQVIKSLSITPAEPASRNLVSL